MGDDDLAARQGIFDRSDTQHVRAILERAGYTAPPEVMDLAFGIEALALAWLAGNTDKLPAGVHEVPADIDAEAANLVLAATGTSIDALTPAQLAYRESWRIGS